MGRVALPPTNEQLLCEFAATTADVPDAVVTAVLRLVLDSAGVALAGVDAPGVAPVVEATTSWGGTGSSIYGARLHVAPPFAALANGVMSTACDFDDTLDDAMLHTMPSVLPAVLALAEVNCVPGREVVAAVAVGAELLCRMGRARRRGQHFLPTGTLAAIAAAAACARVLGLDATRTLDACGIAYTQCAGNVQALHEGRLVKRYHAGLAARNAVTSAELAVRGLTGPHRFLEGENGYYRLYEGGAYEPAGLADELDMRWHLLDLSLKPYPSARDNHGAVEAAIKLAREHNLSVEDIDAVEVALPPNPFGVSGRPFGTLGGDGVVEAIISAAYCTASALARRRQVLDDFIRDRVADAAVVGLASRTHVVPHPAVDDPVTFVPQRLKLTLRDGRTLTQEVSVLLGHPQRPLSDEQIDEKFRQCLAFAGVSDEVGDRIKRTVLALPTLEDSGDLARLLSQARS